MTELGLKPLRVINIENILGAGEDLTKIELAIVAELALKLAAGNRHSSNVVSLIQGCLKMIAIGEKLPSDLRLRILTEV